LEPSIDGEIARISARIRHWREAAELTLQELASRSGLATSTVQKVETGQMIPSVAVLLKLSHGLGRRPTELISEGDADLEVAYIAASEHDRIGDDKSMIIERLSGDLSEPELEMWRVHLQPDASSGRSSIHYEGEEVVVCEKGSVVFTIGDDEYELSAGDSLHFKAHLPHSWCNRGRREARFILTGTLPAKFRAMIRSRI
jgi:transcriptional regulator with XRE-family HTH domain